MHGRGIVLPEPGGALYVGEKKVRVPVGGLATIP